ncbi:hypothetical protein [Ruminococcus sp. zg-924]|uniref:hypothetical protein n=1 Tax=Ruminococcus sp. zg-924 TaxID=2678505 RepID=UPI00210A9FE7|nr:hypothetical protein [Ruminococcus sp. zg-924]MCQ4021802.1 hypothetical protein [Ruminococcus sp. zg-924]
MMKIIKLHIAKMIVYVISFAEVAAITFLSPIVVELKIDIMFFILSLFFVNMFIAVILFKDECFIEFYIDEESKSYYKKSLSFQSLFYAVYKINIRFSLLVDAFCAPLFFVLFIINLQ